MVLSTPRPRILLLAEKPGWALHTIAKNIRHHLSSSFDFTIVTSDDPLPADAACFDIVHALFWEDMRYRIFHTPKTRLLKSVYSHRWQENGWTAREFHHRFLADALRIAVPTPALSQALECLPLPVHLTPEGVDTDLFSPAAAGRSGPLVAGWAGKREDPIKQLDLMQQACGGIIDLHVAGGELNEKEMAEFYRNIDIILCASRAEGCPRPLLEGMSCGAFPVSFPVGIAPEVITHEENGLLITDRTMHGMQAGLRRCIDHADHVRSFSPVNAERIRATRKWENVLPELEKVYRMML